jgi:hypothetical protein
VAATITDIATSRVRAAQVAKQIRTESPRAFETGAWFCTPEGRRRSVFVARAPPLQPLPPAGRVPDAAAASAAAATDAAAGAAASTAAAAPAGVVVAVLYYVL